MKAREVHRQRPNLPDAHGMLDLFILRVTAAGPVHREDGDHCLTENTEGKGCLQCLCRGLLCAAAAILAGTVAAKWVQPTPCNPLACCLPPFFNARPFPHTPALPPAHALGASSLPAMCVFPVALDTLPPPHTHNMHGVDLTGRDLKAH